MTPEEYKGEALKFEVGMLTEYPRLLNGVLGLCGEAGELALAADELEDAVNFHCSVVESKRDAVILELGDVMWYVNLLRDCLGPGVDQGCRYKPRLSTARCLNAAGADRVAWESKLIALEAASVADMLKKHYFQGHGFDADKVDRALRRVMLAAEIIAWNICLTLGEILDRNIEKLSRRYPEGFDPERSVHREEAGTVQPALCTSNLA